MKLKLLEETCTDIDLWKIICEVGLADDQYRLYQHGMWFVPIEA